MDIYQEHGYDDRNDYLEALAYDNDVDVDVVMTLADLLGPNEDFDGLVNAVQDYAG